jgi:4-aminobutyrate aminotransferase-like enzyme
VVPPLVISEDELLQGIDAVDDALDAADAHLA